MKIRSFTAALLLAAMTLAAFAGCSSGDAVTTEAGSVTVTEPVPVTGSDGTTGADTAQDTEPGKVTDAVTAIPDEELSGRNEWKEPLEDDGNGEAILQRLLSASLLKNPDAKPGDNVARTNFAYDIIYWSGFAAQQAVYICRNEYTDMDRHSGEMRRAEIAVNQGYMLKPAGTEFKPEDPITYGEVLRGLLYALGYREYADKVGVAKLAAETGLSNCMDLSKKNSETVTYAEYAQVVSNAMRMNVVQCVEKDGELFTVSRGDSYKFETAYVKNNTEESESIFKCANEGWDIYPGGGYRYGPCMIINEDGTIDAWLASNSGVKGEVDWGKYRRSYDHGVTWTQDTGAVRPTSAAEDWNWSCDPGVIKIGDYYYAAYTTILWHDGLDNNLFIARSRTPQGAFVEKWTGAGWGYDDPKPVVTYDGVKSNWGCGEGAMVEVDGTLYLYVSWNDNTGDYTKVYTADATNENWPATLEYRGIAYKHLGAEDSADVKYVDAYHSFISVATASRFSPNCFVHVMTSYDGVYFRQESVLRHATKSSLIQTNIHNMGITGDARGHIDIFGTQHYIGYAYQPAGFDWANWPTRLTPIVFVGTDAYSDPSNVIKNTKSAQNNTDKTNTPAVTQIRAESIAGGRNIDVKTQGKAYKFVIYYNTKNGQQKDLAAAEYANVEYIYDETKLSVDPENHSVTLLSDEVERLYLKYSDLVCELAVVPAYLDVSKPVEFYPEAEVVTFYLRNEIKQPAFIARSARNQYLMLWGNKSSYTDTTQNDIPKALQKWDQKVELSGWDESIISVDADGKITAKGVGETTITGKYMGFEATMKIVVEKLR